MRILKPYPSLVLDEKKVKNNIQEMAQKASSRKVEFRPHFKTHQSIIIGDWFKEAGVDNITVSSIPMAKYFADEGWKDITIAFPINVLALDDINNLAEKAHIRVLTVDLKTVEILTSKLNNRIGIYLELDPFYGRSGISMNEEELIRNIIQRIEESEKLTLEGFYVHAGHTYKSRSKNEILSITTKVFDKLSELKIKFPVPICFGDTPSCSVLEDFGPADQISPGNFVFYDWIQTRIGSCTPDQVAIAMYCPVVAKYSERKELLIHGGAVHFSKDFDTLKNGKPYFGQVVEQKHIGWGNPIDGCYLKSISQEHGIVACTDDFFENTQIGDHVIILPIHSCLTADVMSGYVSLQKDERIDHFSRQILSK